MEDKLRRYVDGLFARTGLTKKAVELKEEMLQNLSDKYNDLIDEGKTPEAAYNIAIAGIGDVSGLLSELEADDMYEPDMAEYAAAKQKSALLIAMAVMVYILSFLPMLLLSQISGRLYLFIGVPILFVMIAFGTGLLIYNTLTKPKNIKGSATMVEEFREWQTGASDRRSLRRAISSALWTILLAVYFIASFLTDAWAYTWILFILGAAAEAVINIFYTLRGK